MKNEFLVNRLLNLDDEAFVDVLAKIGERSAVVETEIHDELIHITEIKDEIDEVHASWGKLSGLSTGLPSLDKKIGGLRKGEVILIGGETASGKSALATNIAVNVSRNYPILFITLEMLQAEIGSRIKFINNETLDDLDIVFQKEYRIDYRDLKPILDKAHELQEPALVILDYMQYLGRGMTLEEVAKMSKEFKSLALKYQIPFIVIVSIRKGNVMMKRKWTEIEIEDFMGRQP